MPPLLGPVFYSEFVRAARRGRHVLVRLLYALLLFLFLLALYRNYTELTRVASMGAGGMAQFAETFAYSFLVAQLAAVAALTPAYFAGAIAEEKERKTLEFLLATEVRSHEIVFGKFIARLLTLGLLVLTGLPILSLTMLWGGVDVVVLAAVFAGTALTTLSLASLSLLVSVHARTAREAIVLTYLAMAGYLGLTVVGQVVLSVPATATYALTSSAEPLTVEDLLTPFLGGNPVLAALELRKDVLTGTTMQVALPARFKTYALFHILVIVVGLTGAVLRLRALALEEQKPKAPRRPRTERGAWWKPRVGHRPLVWKEVFAEPGMTFNAFGKAVVVLIVLVSFLPALWIGGRFLFDLFRDSGEYIAPFGTDAWWERFSHDVNVWVRTVGTLVASLTLCGVAVRAASAVSGERDQQTLDSLLTVPRNAGEFLAAKWLGSVLSVRAAWLWLALIWLLGGMTGALFLGSVPWLLLAWAAYASFLASLGLWFSCVSTTTLRATIGTLATALVLGIGHWYLYIVVFLPMMQRGDAFTTWLMVEKYALTPPVALAWFAFRGDGTGTEGFLGGRDEDPMSVFFYFLGGVVLWSAGSVVLWFAALRRFRALSGRAVVAPILPPEKATPPRPRRLRRVAVAVVFLALFGVIGWGVRRGILADRDLRAALEETTRHDKYWRVDDIEARRAPVAPHEDLWPLIQEARSHILWNWPGREDLLMVDRLRSDERLGRERVAVLTGNLEDVEDAFPAMQALLDRSKGRFPLAYSRDWIATPLPHVDNQFRLRVLIGYNLLLRLEQGDVAGAADDVLRLGNLGRALGDEPMVVTQNLRLHGAMIAVRSLQRVLAQGEVDDARLAALQAWLVEEESHPGLWLGTRGDRAGMDGLMELIQNGDISLNQYRWALFHGPESNYTTLDFIRFSLTPGAEKENRAALLRYLTHVIDAAALPLEEQGTAFERIEAERKALPVLARELAVWTNVARNNRLWRTQLRAAAVGVAAERYRLKHRRWPTTLDELTPDFLARLPSDPFAAGPLRWKSAEGGMVVYSVGPDGADDGGDVFCIYGEEKTKDIGFRLWNAPRHAKAPPRPADTPP